MLHIDLWQSCQSGISLHRMHMCKQAEAVAWVDSQKDELEERICYEIIYTLVPTASTVSLGVTVGQSRGPESVSKCPEGGRVPLAEKQKYQVGPWIWHNSVLVSLSLSLSHLQKFRTFREIKMRDIYSCKKVSCLFIMVHSFIMPAAV